MFLSYEWRNLLVFALVLAASGLVLVVPPRWGKGRLWRLLVLGLVALDLIVFRWGFNPAADPAWLFFQPPALEFLEEKAREAGHWRLTAYQAEGGTKTFNANIPWLFNIQDIRGYDSIIPKQYTAYIGLVETSERADV